MPSKKEKASADIKRLLDEMDALTGSAISLAEAEDYKSVKRLTAKIDKIQSKVLKKMDAYTNMKFDFVFRAFYFLHLMVARADIAADSSIIDKEDVLNELQYLKKAQERVAKSWS